MTIENPERIVAARWHDTEDGSAYLVVGELEDLEAMDRVRRPGDDGPVQTYVREDVADDEARLFRDQRNILASKLATEEDERDALRRERDALAAERDAMREHLRTVLLAFEEETSQGDGICEEHAPGYEAAKVAAGKGVG